MSPLSTASVPLSQAQRIATAEVLPELADRLMLNEKNPRKISFTTEELRTQKCVRNRFVVGKTLNRSVTSTTRTLYCFVVWFILLFQQRKKEMAKKAAASPQLNKSDTLREWFAKQKNSVKWRQSKDEVQAYLEKAGHTYNEKSDYQTFNRIHGELGLVSTRAKRPEISLWRVTHTLNIDFTKESSYKSSCIQPPINQNITKRRLAEMKQVDLAEMEQVERRFARERFHEHFTWDTTGDAAIASVIKDLRRHHNVVYMAAVASGSDTFEVTSMGDRSGGIIDVDAVIADRLIAGDITR